MPVSFSASVLWRHWADILIASSDSWTICLRYTVCLSAVPPQDAFWAHLKWNKTKRWVHVSRWVWHLADISHGAKGRKRLQPLTLLLPLCCHILPIKSSWENHMPLTYQITVTKMLESRARTVSRQDVKETVQVCFKSDSVIHKLNHVLAASH